MTDTTVAAWLDNLGMAAFAANDIDASLVDDLDDADLIATGVASLGHRKRMPTPRMPPSPPIRRRSSPS
ncbi:MAG: hypothetical protein RID91_05410 [Azospirillaceae bacterium]